jgi:hypothetical protein
MEEIKSKFGSVKYKVDNDKYLKLLNYINGIKDLERVGDEIRPTFIGVEGALYLIKFPNSDKGYIINDQIKFTNDKELNKTILDGLVKRLEE